MFLAFSFDIQSGFAWMTPKIPTYMHWQLPEDCFILLVECLWADNKQIGRLLTRPLRFTAYDPGQHYSRSNELHVMSSVIKPQSDRHTQVALTPSVGRKEKKRKDYTFRRQFNEKTRELILGCPGLNQHTFVASVHDCCFLQGS